MPAATNALDLGEVAQAGHVGAQPSRAGIRGVEGPVARPAVGQVVDAAHTVHDLRVGVVPDPRGLVRRRGALPQCSRSIVVDVGEHHDSPAVVPLGEDADVQPLRVRRDRDLVTPPHTGSARRLVSREVEARGGAGDERHRRARRSRHPGVRGPVTRSCHRSTPRPGEDSQVSVETLPGSKVCPGTVVRVIGDSPAGSSSAHRAKVNHGVQPASSAHPPLDPQPRAGRRPGVPRRDELRCGERGLDDR